ncbi:MAG: hypothetical protein IT426_14825 [Pirellulales bacterium]|nr:hypothetical protein [Pirellulales bacterium]
MKMFRAWTAVALLAGSWMFGLGYFYPADYATWTVLLAAAMLLLYGTPIPLPDKGERWLAAALLLPAAIWTPRPYAIIPLLLLIGLVLQNMPGRLRMLKSFGNGLLATGGILLVQALALAAYTAQTARSHELPAPLAHLLAAVGRVFSIDAAFDGANIVFRTMRQTHRLAPTWELLFDPVSLCFLVGGMLFLGLKIAGEQTPGKRWTPWVRALRIFTAIVLVWLPIRAGLLMALYVHRVLNFDPERSLYVMNHFFAPWPLLLYTIVPMLLAWRFVRSKLPPLPLGEGPGVRADAARNSPTPSFAWRRLAALLLTALATAIFTLAVEWSPVGKRKAGRVKVVERHSAWEPTFMPEGYKSHTAWYGHDASYSYTEIYDYLGQFYEMSRIMEDGKIDAATLADCDVLIVKTPTAGRYAKEEIEAVLEFVRRGGGVLFVGDHTNLDGMGTTMNDIARPMGFTFRDDLLFSNERTKIRQLKDISPETALQDEPTSPDERTCYHQLYVPPWPAHPALSYMTPMEFAVSCSVDPGGSRGRAVIANTGLWSMPPEYHMSNFHPIPQHCAPMRYGAFVQLWATEYGDGRAMAFTDSTIFSNFCIYQPSKAELMLGQIEWLNRENPPLEPRFWLNLLGAVTLLAVAWLALRSGFRAESLACFAAAGMAGWIAACGLTATLHRASMPLPEALRPMLRVVVDRTASNVPLSLGAYTKGENGSGFGLLEQWIPRLKIDGRGVYTIRQKDDAALSGDALVVIAPTQPVSEDYRRKLLNYVQNGGKLLVFDSPDANHEVANELLSPFNIRIERGNPLAGSLILKDRWPNIPVEKAGKVTGGTAIAEIDGQPVAAVTHRGKGAVMAVGFGSLFNDRNLGGTWSADPNDDAKRRYNVLYALVRSLLSDKPVEATTEAFGDAPGTEIPRELPKNETGGRKTSPDLPELPLKEMGPEE